MTTGASMFLVLLAVTSSFVVSSARLSAPRNGYPKCWTAGLWTDGKTSNDPGDEVTILCVSKGGSPPTLEWSIDGTIVSPDSETTTSSRTQKTMNKYTWTLESSQDGAIGTCTSVHPIAGTRTCNIGPIMVSGASGRDLQRNSRLLDALMDLLDEETEEGDF